MIAALVVLAAVVAAVVIANTRGYLRATRRPGYLIGGPETRQQNAAALREQPAARPTER